MRYNSYNHRFYFTGKGLRYFGIWATNVVLTVITLGLYYPWAKVAMRKFLWNETVLNEDRFVFHGTGMEIFRGFVIAYGMIAALIACIFIMPMGILIFYLGAMLLAPFAIYGGWRYRLSRTSWRGIHFSFRGDLGEFLGIYFVGLILTIFTFGIYASWWRVKIMKYLFSNSQLGNYELDFDGDGGELFGINILGIILSVVTFYIYLPWYIANRFNFTFKNIAIHHDGMKSRLYSNLQGGDVLVLMITNMLLIIFTFGIGFPWAYMRTLKLYIESIEVPEEVNLDGLLQDADDYDDATGDDLLDILDVGLEF